MSRDLTLHVIRCTIAGSPARVYSCNQREARTFAQRMKARVTSRRLPRAWSSLVSPNDRPMASPSSDHVDAAAATRTHTSLLRLVRSR